MPRKGAGARRATNVSLDAALLEEARTLDINISRACERGLAARIAELRAERWRSDNTEALVSSNRHVEENGVPLARYRGF